MNIIYIKETDKTCDIVKVIVIKIKKILNIVDIKYDEDKTTYCLPVFENTKISKLKTKKLVNKTNKLLEKNGAYNVVLSEYLERNQLFKNYLYGKNINILNGNFLFKCLTYKILEYIFNIANKEIKSSEVSLLINDFTDMNIEVIINIAKNIKRLNIVTNHIEKCNKIEEYLYNEFGVMLNVSNNKSKSLLKSEIIINIDFPEELINKYKIYDKAIILNINESIVLKSKRFNGININYYKINIPDEYKLEGFKDELIYESLIYGKNYEEISKKIIKDNIKIEKLIGRNGPIIEKEINK